RAPAPPLRPPLAHWMHASARFHVARSDPDGRVVEEVLVAWSESAGRLRDPGDLAPFREWLLTRRRPLPPLPDLLSPLPPARPRAGPRPSPSIRPSIRSSPSRIVIGCGGQPGTNRSTGTIASAP